jgi:hypothetical protein
VRPVGVAEKPPGVAEWAPDERLRASRNGPCGSRTGNQGLCRRIQCHVDDTAVQGSAAIDEMPLAIGMFDDEDVG